MTRSWLLIACFALAAVSLGCGKPSTGPQLVTVTGVASFDGNPIETGRILFRKVEGDQKSFSGEILKGSYKLQAEPGKMAVEIVASRPVPGKFDNSNGTPEPVGEMYIPEKFNAKTTLTTDIAPGSSATVPFELKSK